MSLAQITFVSCCIAALTACGQMKDQDKPAAKTEAPAQVTGENQSKMVDARQANLPLAGIIRVPVDQDGKEQLDQADFRTIKGTKQLKDAAAIDSAFEGGSTPTNVKDELDGDSSTESWGSWGCGYGRYGNYGSYGGYGYGNYGYGGGYYNSWRPSCNYYGYGYTYGSANYYNYGGYNYYYYPNSYYY